MMFCAEATETWRSSLCPPKRTIGVMVQVSSGFVAKQHAIAAIVCLFCAIAMTWPLTFAIDRAVAYPGDPFINTWILDWDWYATLHQPLDLFEANAFYPAHDSLAFSENLYGIALVLFPLRALGVPPLAAHNVAMLLGFAFSMFAAYLLGRMITGCWIAGIAAGIYYAFVPWRFTQLPHVQHIWGGWVPMRLVALLHYARRPTWRSAALFGAAFVMNGLINIHWLILGSFAIACSVPIAVRNPRDWIRIAFVTLIALAILTPFLLPYAHVAKEYGMKRGWEEAKLFSAHFRDWLNPGFANRVYRRFADPKMEPEAWLFPGFLGILMATAGLIVGLRRRGAGAPLGILLIVLGVVGSLGLHAFFHRFLFAHVPGFQAIRVPARWANIAYVGMSMLIAFAVSSIANWRRVAAYIIAIAFLFELRAAPIRWFSAVPNPPQVHKWLATQDVRIAELPLTLGDYDYLYMLRATANHRPMVNGISGFTPPMTAHLTDLWTNRKYDELLDELRRIRVDRIVVHADVTGDNDAQLRPWLRKKLDEGRLQFVSRFNAGPSGDWVFAIGGAPRPRSEALERLLNNQYSFTNGTIGIFDYPRWGDHIEGPALFSGWALSPYGIRKVEFLLDNGQVRIPARLIEDKGVSHGLPWYSATPRPRFIASFDRRPKNVRPDTDVQVEITDGQGNKTVLDGRPIDWIR